MLPQHMRRVNIFFIYIVVFCFNFLTSKNSFFVIFCHKHAKNLSQLSMFSSDILYRLRGFAHYFFPNNPKAYRKNNVNFRRNKKKSRITAAHLVSDCLHHSNLRRPGYVCGTRYTFFYTFCVEYC